jgi:hypothetical protein
MDPHCARLISWWKHANLTPRISWELSVSGPHSDAPKVKKTLDVNRLEMTGMSHIMENLSGYFNTLPAPCSPAGRYAVPYDTHLEPLGILLLPS